MMTPTEQKKALSRLKAQLTRRRNNPGSTYQYACQGGPLNGEYIFLRTASTAIFTIGQFTGWYRAISARSYRQYTYHAEWVPHQPLL
jgi:hypothetical protein